MKKLSQIRIKMSLKRMNLRREVKQAKRLKKMQKKNLKTMQKTKQKKMTR